MIRQRLTNITARSNIFSPKCSLTKGNAIGAIRRTAPKIGPAHYGRLRDNRLFRLLADVTETTRHLTVLVPESPSPRIDRPTVLETPGIGLAGVPVTVHILVAPVHPAMGQPRRIHQTQTDPIVRVDVGTGPGHKGPHVVMVRLGDAGQMGAHVEAGGLGVVPGVVGFGEEEAALRGTVVKPVTGGARPAAHWKQINQNFLLSHTLTPIFTKKI